MGGSSTLGKAASEITIQNLAASYQRIQEELGGGLTCIMQGIINHYLVRPGINTL